MEKVLSEQEILKLAATWNEAKAGRNREEDGTVPGWHQWSRSHSQKDDSIEVCHGREEWQRTQKNSKNVSLVSWNILSDTWWHTGKGGYDHTPQEQGEWSFRLELLLEKWIEPLNPDVLALQEVDYQKFQDDLRLKLTLRGYHGSMQKPKKKTDKQPCGVATFWKSSKFQLVKETSFSRTQCVLLKCLTSSNEICITNVHLESSQSELGSDRRARQLNSALAYAAAEAPNAALLVCGDCNTGADAQLFRVLREHQWHGHTLSSVYEHPDTHKTSAVSLGTFLVPGHHYVIDHILYDQGTLQLRCAFDAFSQEELEEHVVSKGEECGFPSVFCPSDHIPIGAMFELLPQTAQPKRCCEPKARVVSEERKAELEAEWESLQSQRPPQTKGKPTPDQIAERQVYAAAVKTWKKTVMDNSSELDFVTKLIKGKK